MADFRFAILVAVVLLACSSTQGQDCKETHNATKFRRIFLGYHNGDIFGVEGREQALIGLGGCRTPEEHADKMIELFQTRYALNLTHMRQDPFRSYDEDQYVITQGASQDIIISGLTPGYARFMNSPLYWTAWFLTTKRNLMTPNGVIQAGYTIYYSMHRFHVDGRYACVELKQRSPTGVFLQENGAAALNDILHEPEFGEGEARGMAIPEGNQIALRYVLNFSG